VSDADCVAFLQWALPQLGLRWAGFRRNKRQVCRRIEHRRAELGLADLASYRRYLADHGDEWTTLAGLCRVTISRFARDRDVWTALVADVLPRLARDATGATVHAWSAGCGAGEEPYTLAIAWLIAIAPRWPAVAIDILATDIDDVQLARAATARFPTTTLRELPVDWQRAAFEPIDGDVRIRDHVRAPVRFEHRDLRSPPPAGPFDLVLCRNLAFSYFDEPLQRSVAAQLREVMRTGAALVVGLDEHLPDGVTGFAPLSPYIYTAI
jgi:chemotaxis protein methyltransferase CheR